MQIRRFFDAGCKRQPMAIPNRRRLLDVSMVWEVRVPQPTGNASKDFNWTRVDVNSKAECKVSLSQLGLFLRAVCSTHCKSG
jgi:hypothetical protein